jgi:hypothetical protein
MADLSLKRVRSRLTPRREPYWQRLGEGAYLGFRRGPDTWIARFRGRDKKQNYQTLGEALEFDEAKERAEDWFGQLPGSAVRTIKRGTVLAGLQSYLADLRRHGREAAAKKADGQFKAALQLETATKDDFLDWRDRLHPGRLPRTVNRLVRAVVAGLNRAHALGHTGTPAA